MSARAALSAAEEARLRDGVAEAVLAGPVDLRAALEHDPESYLRLVTAARVGAEETSRLLREAIGGARRAGHSWDAVGRVLGVSRQAAQQRFAPAGPGSDAAPTEPGAPARRVLTPLTAFDEMEALDREGRQGWHLVDFGPLFHVVEASDHPWEHRRVPFAGGSRLRRLQAEGWMPVGTWFPWRYLKRPLAISNTDS
ncbi:MAG: hypothetical protein M3417_14950 [Actinomycetota bacterium]|nr:hypothetical protein [Actinomycetota bacterium]